MIRKRVYRRRTTSLRSAKTNMASLKENFTVPVGDGTMTFFRNVRLANATYDRAQAVAAAYQEFKVRYVKFTIRPSADTFPLAAGNVIPQLYFQVDKANTIPINATLQTLQDMGCRPIRFDDKNIVRTYRPNILVGADTTGLGIDAAVVKAAPWLSTNATAGNPTTVWSPSAVDHIGCCMFITKINPLTPAVNVNVEIEVVFDFRKPLWRSTVGMGESNSVSFVGDVPTHSGL